MRMRARRRHPLFYDDLVGTLFAHLEVPSQRTYARLRGARSGFFANQTWMPMMSQWNQRPDPYRNPERAQRQYGFDEERPRRRGPQERYPGDSGWEFSRRPYGTRDSVRRDTDNASEHDWSDEDYRYLSEYPRADRFYTRPAYPRGQNEFPPQRPMEWAWSDRRWVPERSRQPGRRSEDFVRRYQDSGPYIGQPPYTYASHQEPYEHWRSPGPHTGRGPSGYRRSAERITGDVCEPLESHGNVDAAQISIDVDKECNFTLTGSVPTRQQKRMAEDAVESVRGLKDVHNRLSVRGNDDETDLHSVNPTRKSVDTAQKQHTN